jgi:hypothetical protein
LNGVQAFRQEFAVTDTLNTQTFSSFDARLMRYRINWAYVESTAYASVHKWSESLKQEYGLYEYTRNIYNPAFRIAMFWATHLMGGSLDPAAGDGKSVRSALPIITPQSMPSMKADRLRVAVAQTWRNSNWQTNKDIYTLYGPVMGDVGIEIVDDPQRGKVYKNVLHPGAIKSVELDEYGFVKGYVQEEFRNDPRVLAKSDSVTAPSLRPVVYNKIVTRDGDNVVYETYLDGSLYAWPDHLDRNGEMVAQWEEPYGFVPLVLVKHINVGADWGWGEFHATLSKIREADDLGSKLDDQIRKTVDAKWGILGAARPLDTPTVGGRETSDEVFEPGREEEGMIYFPNGADFKPMVAPLEIGQTSDHIMTLLAAWREQHPELRNAIYGLAEDGTAANVSGETIRRARQPVEEKADLYRPHYDDGEARSNQMAIAIGGWRGYKGYEGFGLESYIGGDLEHSIGERPVFGKNQFDELELKERRYTVLRLAKDSGIADAIAQAEVGMTDDEIAKNKEALDAANPDAPVAAAAAAVHKALADFNASQQADNTAADVTQ